MTYSKMKTTISKTKQKFFLTDSSGNRFGLQATKVIEERENDYVCVTFYENKKIIGRFYNYTSLVLIDEEPINQTIN